MTVYRRGAVYYYDFWVDGIRHRRAVGPRRGDAVRAERVVRGRLLDGRLAREYGLGVRRPGGPTVRRFIEGEWLPAQAIRLARSTMFTVRCHVRPFVRLFGHLSLGRVTGEVLEAHRDARLGAVSPNTLRDEMATIRQVLALAQRRGYLAAVPGRVELPPRLPPPDRILTAGEERRLFAEQRHPLLDAFRLALYTGLRRGELQALTPAHVDLAGRRIVLRQPKTGRVKAVPLGPEALAILRRRLPAERDRPIFGRRDGRPYHPVTLSAVFKRLCADAGLGRLRLHDLRHTVAVRLLRAGTDLATVARFLGHARTESTLRYIAHVDEAHLRQAATHLRSPHGRLAKG